MALRLDDLHGALLVRQRGGGRPLAAAPPAAAGAAKAGAKAAAAPPPQAAPGKEGKEKKVKEAKPEKVKPTWGEPGSGKAKKEGAKKIAPVEEKIEIPVTPEGEKKDLSGPMTANYHPKSVEAAWSAWWEKKGCFTPDAKSAKGTAESKRFIMVIPPPNVTGSLHIGHTLTGAIEDALTRWHRMCGDVTLWLPGTDHAGIATQSVVEKLMYKTEGKTRHDLGREKFLERVWAWKHKNTDHIKHQLHKIAASTDWTRERFTMDPMLNKAVVEAFCRFHEQGLIYRDNRLVNWSPHLRTALSDLEVDHEDIPGTTLVEIPGYSGKVEVGVLCEFKYEIKGQKGKSVTVATTRLETMLGDVAVAVHPDDKRYTDIVGKELVHPFFPDRKMVVLADTMVDPEFGTGCVKITPAHDPNDFKCGQRHGLEFINILAEDGHIRGTCGKFSGQHRFEARKTVEEALKEKGLWVQKKPHAMRLGFCSRSKDIVEPYLKPQWWMNCKDLADKSVKAVREGTLTIVPEFHHDTWYRWLENIQEWCISRQLWWGHRIPAYKVVHPVQEKEAWFAGRNEAEALERARKKFGKDVKIEQDEDVLDTWFSSGLFPFSVFGWPDKTDDFDAFFPTSLLETGHDILFFWVARMVMMSIGLTGKLPFHTVYLHAMVRDAHGRKMSKSLGNVIDPIEVVDGISLEDLNQKLYAGNLPEKEIEKAKKGQAADYPEGIPECGADALRFGLLAYTLQGRNVNLDIARVVGWRHFCNKIWNATKFGLKYMGDDFKFPGAITLDAGLAWEDRWILHRLSACGDKSDKAFKNYEFASATTATHAFFQYEFCDVYLELLKPRFNISEEELEKLSDAERAARENNQMIAREVIYVCLDWSLRLMHPLLPYLTEELYQRLPPSPTKVESIVIANYPTVVNAWFNDQVDQEMALIAPVAKALRSQKQSLGFSPKMEPKVWVRHAEDDARATLKKLAKPLGKMGIVGDLIVMGSSDAEPKNAVRGVVDDKCIIFMNAEGVDLSAELAKLKKKADTAEKMAQSWEKKMSMPGYEEKVPLPVQIQNKEKMEQCNIECSELKLSVQSLKAAMS